MSNLLEIGRIQEKLYREIDGLIVEGVKLSTISNKIIECYSIYNLEIIEDTEPVTINKNNIVYHNTDFSDSLKTNDIVTIDTCFKYCGDVVDGAKTYCLGDKHKELLNVSKEVVISAAKIVQEGVKVSSLLNHISDYIAVRGYYLFPEGIGHGIGNNLHKHPYLSLKYYDDYSYTFKKGDYFTIEPIVFLFKDSVKEGDCNQGIISANNASSQFEVSIFIDNNGLVKIINGGLLK